MCMFRMLLPHGFLRLELSLMAKLWNQCRLFQSHSFAMEVFGRQVRCLSTVPHKGLVDCLETRALSTLLQRLARLSYCKCNS